MVLNDYVEKLKTINFGRTIIVICKKASQDSKTFLIGYIFVLEP